MRESDLGVEYSQMKRRHWIANVTSGIAHALRIVAFALLALLEPVARLSIMLALLCAGSAGLFALTGPENAPVKELLIGTGVLMLLSVLYYLLIRSLRP
jgi:hypothetical protein